MSDVGSMERGGGRADEPSRGVYGISVAAEMAGVGVQTLRLYEQHGLLQPARTSGGTRQYSIDDITRMREIGRLVAAGLNLAGVAAVLNLQAENARLSAELHKLRR